MVVAIKSDIGSGGRGKGNEDNVISITFNIDKGPDQGVYHLLAVADGMGGHEKGEVASALALRGIVKSLITSLVTDKGFFSKDDKTADISELLRDSIEKANLLIYNICHRDNSTSSMGSTIVAGLIKNGKLFIAHVGDSRGYLIRKNCVERLTTDHSLVQILYDSHVINTGELYNHPQKNVITRALGLFPKVQVEINEKRKGNPVTLQPDDLILLCTDGLSNVIEEEELPVIVKKSNFNSLTIVDELIKLANIRRTDDNATVLCALIKKDDLSDTPHKINKSATSEGRSYKKTKVPTVTLPSPTILCPGCGYKNTLGDIHCKSCNNSLIFISRKPWISILDGPDKGKRIELEKDTIYIGRDPDSDMYINEPPGMEFISRKHIKIFKKGEDYWIEDLNSSNGTKLKGQQIKGKQMKLENCDLIVIGMNTLEFCL